jgi:hypothetical protein
MAKTTDSITSETPQGAPAQGSQPRGLRVQAMIWQAKTTMTRAELEEYADELTREGLIDDMAADSAS